MRLTHLEARLDNGDETTWRAYGETAAALASVVARLTPGASGELLTTRQLAERLNIAPKTLLKRKKRHQITPALQHGKLIRWRGDEVAR